MTFYVSYFLSLFEDVDTHEAEIWAMIAQMTEEDVDAVEHECKKDLVKYYDIYCDLRSYWMIAQEG